MRPGRGTLIWLFLISGATVVRGAAPRLEARECPPAARNAGARCGVVYVPENHAQPRGRKIGLNVLILPAIHAADPTRAQYDLEGGPGFAATDFLEFYAGDGAAFRATRDIVLADMRGTGGSNPLRCAGIEEREKRQPLAAMYPPDLVAECARQVSVASDPRQYSTAAAAQDIELVRRALGYEQLDLNAISYGTTLALRYIADFPKRVHAAVLMGTVPPKYTPPRFHASAAQASLERLASTCDADIACRKFGDFHENLRQALEHSKESGALTTHVFMEKLRTQLYAPFSRARVPFLVSRAAQGDFSAFTESGGGRVFADGLYLSITCAESFARMNVPEAIAAARSTSFGAYRLERQAAACEQWPRTVADPDLMQLRDSQVPVLFIAGELDPVSPADWAREVVQHFPHGRVVSAPQGAHVFDGLSGLDSCLDGATLQFLDSADAGALDLACFADMQPPPFGASR